MDTLFLDTVTDIPIWHSSKGAIYIKDNKLFFKTKTGTAIDLSSAVTDSGAAAWPIGSVFLSIVDTNPSVLLGFGTWSQIAQGQMLIGQKGTDTDFDTAEETGGSKTHTNTEAEMVSHTHVQNAHNHTQQSHDHNMPSVIRNVIGVGAKTGTGTDIGIGGNTDNVVAINNPATALNQNTGGGAAYSIMNPYFVVYIWKRTA